VPSASKWRRLPLALVLLGAAAALLRHGPGSGATADAPPTPPTRPSNAATPPSRRVGTAAPGELARLRAENARLREQLAARETERTETREEMADVLHELAELRRPLEIDMASTALRAQLSPGEGVVTGGYRLPDGTRLYAFIETNEGPGGAIGVTGRFYSLSDATARALNLQNLFTEAANTLQHGEVWLREEIADVTSRLHGAGTARAIGLGTTSLATGEAAIVPIASDPPLTYRVYLERDGQNQLEVDLRLESIPPAPAAPPSP
jgi:hypothetical protein